MPFHKTVMILPSTRMALASRSDSPAPSILIPHWTSSLFFLFFSARFLERRVVAFEQREALRACFLLGSHLGSLLSHEPQYQPLTIEAQQKRKPKVLSRRAVYQFVEKRTLIRCRLEKAGREGRGAFLMYRADDTLTTPPTTGTPLPTSIPTPRGSIDTRIIIGYGFPFGSCVATEPTAADTEPHRTATRILTTLTTMTAKRTIRLATFWAERVTLLVASVHCVDRPSQ